MCDFPKPRIAPQKPAASQGSIQYKRVRARGAVINIVDVYKYLLRHDFHLSCRVSQYPLRGSGSDKEKPLQGCARQGLVTTGSSVFPIHFGGIVLQTQARGKRVDG